MKEDKSPFYVGRNSMTSKVNTWKYWADKIRTVCYWI